MVQYIVWISAADIVTKSLSPVKMIDYSLQYISNMVNCPALHKGSLDLELGYPLNK